MHIHKDAYELTRSFTISAIFAIGKCAYIIEIVYELPVNDTTARQLRSIFEREAQWSNVWQSVLKYLREFWRWLGSSIMTVYFIG